MERLALLILIRAGMVVAGAIVALGLFQLLT